MRSIWIRFRTLLGMERPEQHKPFLGIRPQDTEKPFYRWLTVFILGLSITWMMPRGRSLQFSEFKEGSISSQRIVAPFGFEILKSDEEYLRDRRLAAQAVPPVFTRDREALQQVQAQMDQFFKEVSRIEPGQEISGEWIADLKRKFPRLTLSEAGWTLFAGSIRDAVDWTRLGQESRTIVRDLMALGVMDEAKTGFDSPDQRVLVDEGNEEAAYPFNRFNDLQEARIKAAARVVQAFPLPPARSLAVEIVQSFIRPTLKYQKGLHETRIQEAQSRVPRSSGFVDENEKILDRNERVTPEIRKKLVSLETKITEKGMQGGGIRVVLPFTGRLTFVFGLLFIIGVYVRLDKREILEKTKSVLLMSLMILLTSVVSFLIFKIESSSQEALAGQLTTPAAMGAMLLASVFGDRIGFAGSAVLALLIGGIWGNDFDVAAISFLTGVVGVLVITRMRNRRQLIQAILMMIAAYLAGVTAIGLLRYMPFEDILRKWPWGALNGLLIPIVSYGFIAVVESTFDIATDFALLELSNLNHPLMKRFSIEASGTYHHSVLVGNMAEASAQAVGANSLLARVGALYHDIGKIEKPEYFVENQIGNENPHRKLAPSMSALILGNHVKKGMELAEKFGIPTAVRDIMVQHHGRTVMSFFYQKAVSKQGQDAVNEEDFRYPGPLPQTKEAAIVMLADAVEASTRSIKDPSPGRIKGVIEDIVQERFQSGELNESPITLRDLEKIKESFLISLAGLFHTRLEYPEKEDGRGQVKTKKDKDPEQAKPA